MLYVTTKNFIFFIASFLIVSCSQIQPHPDFWQTTQVHKVDKTKIVFEPQSIEDDLAPPSISLSEWSLISKSSFALREYKLVLRDQSGKLIDSLQAPEFRVDGPAKILNLSKISPATWKVRMEYLYDPAIVNLGFKLGSHRVDSFRQIQYQLHDLDMLETKSFTQKTRVRADGEDKLRIYVHMKDKRGYSIFSTTDYKLQLIVDRSSVDVAGPFSAMGGPYFEISSQDAGSVKYTVEIDGTEISGHGDAMFVANDLRGPAAEDKNCLKDLAHLAGVSVPDLSPVKAYKELVKNILKIYEENNDSSLERYQFVLDTFSSSSCTSRKIWDAAREEAGRELRHVHRRISR